MFPSPEAVTLIPASKIHERYEAAAAERSVYIPFKKRALTAAACAHSRTYARGRLSRGSNVARGKCIVRLKNIYCEVKGDTFVAGHKHLDNSLFRLLARRGTLLEARRTAGNANERMRQREFEFRGGVVRGEVRRGWRGGGKVSRCDNWAV